MAKKRSLPLAKVYQLLEPGPVTLVTTADKTGANVIAMSWHTMLDFEPPLLACVVSNRNHSFETLRKTKQCVINIPTKNLLKKVVKCGTISGRRVDKFAKFHLSPLPASKIKAPLIEECYANLECKVVDTTLVNKYNLFILKVIKAWIDPGVKHPQTIHHCGRGRFMIGSKKLKVVASKRGVL